jgi:hypothetical protein
VGLEQGPLSLTSITEDLLESKSSGSESRKPRLMVMVICCADHDTLYPQKLALTSPTSGGRSASIVCLGTKAMEFSFFYLTWTIMDTLHKDLLVFHEYLEHHLWDIYGSGKWNTDFMLITFLLQVVQLQKILYVVTR